MVGIAIGIGVAIAVAIAIGLKRVPMPIAIETATPIPIPIPMDTGHFMLHRVPHGGMRGCFENTWAPAAGRGPGSNTPAERGAVWQPAPTWLSHFHASSGPAWRDGRLFSDHCSATTFDLPALSIENLILW